MDSLPVYRHTDTGCAHFTNATGRFQRVAECEPLVLRRNQDLRSDNLPDEGSGELRPVSKQRHSNGRSRASESKRSCDSERLPLAHAWLPFGDAKLDWTGSSPD